MSFMGPSASPEDLKKSEKYWKDELKLAFNLLDQIIEKKQFDNSKENKPGESWDLHHLKLLKKTLRNAVGPFEVE